MSAAVSHNVPKHRFEVDTPEGVAHLRYIAKGDLLHLVHTEVPTALEGLGIGSSLAHAALEYAKGKALRVVPRCRFVKAYIDEHPEYQRLVAT